MASHISRNCLEVAGNGLALSVSDGLTDSLLNVESVSLIHVPSDVITCKLVDCSQIDVKDSRCFGFVGANESY